MPQSSLPEKPYTKNQLINEIATNTGLSRKDVLAVFSSLTDVIGLHLQNPSVASFNLPGLLKIKVQHKPAQESRQGVPNPFRPGETMEIASKPASKAVRIIPLKALKDMVS